MKATDQAQLTQVRRGSPLGETLRRYWTPVCLSEEVAVPGGPPHPVKVLDENLVVFRQADGTVGLLSAKCPHRGADLKFGRNEGEGLRCLYHGWKFDLGGKCVDMPNEPAEATFKDKVTTTAYPCREAAGAIWAYLGPLELMPEMPKLDCLTVPDSHVRAYKREQEAYFMQCLEGDIDSSHVAFLHGDEIREAAAGVRDTLDLVRPEYRPNAINTARWQLDDTKPLIETLDHGSGVFVAVVRSAGPGECYVRVNQWQMPYYTGIPAETGDGGLMLHAWVPVDDRNTMVYNFHYHPVRPLTDVEIAANDSVTDANSSNIAGTYKPYYNKSNNYGIDELGWAPGTGTRWTSIPSVPAQDMAMTEGIGFDHDRGLEHLAASDSGVIAFRRALLRAIRDREAGRPMVGGEPDSYYIRQFSAVIASDKVWAWPEIVMQHTAGGKDHFRPSGLPITADPAESVAV